MEPFDRSYTTFYWSAVISVVPFLSSVSILTRDIYIANLSVRP